MNRIVAWSRYGNNVKIPSPVPPIKFIVEAEKLLDPESAQKLGSQNDRKSIPYSKPNEAFMVPLPSYVVLFVAWQALNKREPIDPVAQVTSKPVVGDDKYELRLTNVTFHPWAKKGTPGTKAYKSSRKKNYSVFGPKGQNALKRRATFKVSMALGDADLQSEQMKVLMLPGVPEQAAVDWLGDTDLSQHCVEDGQDVITVQNLGACVDFRVQLVDIYNNPTFPANRASVDVFLEAVKPGTNEKLAIFPESGRFAHGTCDAKGGVTFEKLIVDASEFRKLFGQKIPVNLTFKGPPGFMDVDGGEAEAEEMFLLEILASKAAATAQVWAKVGEREEAEEMRIDRDEDELSFLECAGLLIDNLFLKLISEAGNEVELPKGSKVTASWGNRKKASASAILPPLQLPPQVESDNIGCEYSVTVAMPKRDAIVTHFTIQVVPGQPKKWQVRIDNDQIQCGERNQLSGSVSVFVTDGHGNATTLEVPGGTPVPKICIDGPTIEETSAKTLKLITGPTPITASQSSTGLAPPINFRFTPDSILLGNPCECTIRVSSPADGGEGTVLDDGHGVVFLVPGSACAIQLSSDAILTEGCEKSDTVNLYPANVTSNLELSDLRASIVDRCGNVVAEAAKLSLKSASLPGFKAVTTRAKAGTATFPSVQLVVTPGLSAYTLDVNGSVGQRPLTPARLSCSVELSNEVCEITHSLDVRMAVAGQPFDAVVTLSIVTEDRQGFEPPSDAFSISIKLKGNNKPRDTITSANSAVSTSDLRATTTQWVTDEDTPQPFIPTKSGTYQVTCSYQEIRTTQSSSMMDSIAPLKFDVEVRPAPPEQLKLKNGSTPWAAKQTKNVSNGNDPRHRNIFKRPVIYAEDKFKNRASLEAVRGVTAQLVAEIGVDTSLSTSTPALEGVEHNEGVVCTVRDGGGFRYEQDLALQEGQGDTEGVYYLLFSVIPDDSSLIPDHGLPKVNPCKVTLAFSPDGQRSEQLQIKQTRVQELQERIRGRNSKYTEKYDSHSEKLSDLRDIKESLLKTAQNLDRLPGRWGSDFAEALQKALDDKKTKLDKMDNDDVERLLSQCHERREVLKHDPSRREAKMKPIHAAVRKLGTPLVELGCVTDEKEAVILSWICSGLCNREGPGILAPDTRKLLRVSKEYKLPGYSEDLLMAQKLPKLPVTNEEFQRESDMQIEMPQYAVNMIELPPTKEKLRSTVFHAMLGRGLVMQTIEEAVEYRRVAVKLQRGCPNIITMDGA